MIHNDICIVSRSLNLPVVLEDVVELYLCRTKDHNEEIPHLNSSVNRKLWSVVKDRMVKESKIQNILDLRERMLPEEGGNDQFFIVCFTLREQVCNC